jgi:hypothetical protein
MAQVDSPIAAVFNSPVPFVSRVAVAVVVWMASCTAMSCVVIVAASDYKRPGGVQISAGTLRLHTIRFTLYEPHYTSHTIQGTL